MKDPLVIETYGKPTEGMLQMLTDKGPHVHNGDVRVERYKITIERIDEPVETYRQRLLELLKQRLHIDARKAIRTTAARLGVSLED